MNDSRILPAQEIKDDLPGELLLHPAVRAFWPQHLRMLLGLALCSYPLWALAHLGFPRPENGWMVALSLAIVAGGTVTTVNAIHFLWAYVANVYRIDWRGVEQMQWYFEQGRLRRRSPRVTFAHLSSVEVDQGTIERLLNVGTVKLAAGATDGQPVILRWVLQPTQLQRQFQHLAARHRGDSRISQTVS